MDLHQLCQQAVGKRIRYTGTNGDEYDKVNHGKRVEGEGDCIEYHDSHGLCLIIQDGTQLCVDPETIEIVSAPPLSRIIHTTFLYHDSMGRMGECGCDVLLGDRFIVVFTELKNNPGPSVTNCAEYIIKQYCAEHKIPEGDILFVERYEDRPNELDEIIYGEKEPSWRRLLNHEAAPIIEALK